MSSRTPNNPVYPGQGVDTEARREQQEREKREQQEKEKKEKERNKKEKKAE